MSDKGMTIARPHRGMLAASMAEAEPCRTLDELVAIINRDKLGALVQPENVSVSFYCYDERIKQHVYLVQLKGDGVWGMTDGPLP